MAQNTAYQQLVSALASFPRANYWLRSRVHPLPSFHTDKSLAFVKRDDELGSNGLGSKLRKYETLIGFLVSEGFEETIVIGSAHSNHVLGISQLLIENNIQPTLFLKKNSNQIDNQGNLLLTHAFVPDHSIRWISHSEWPLVARLAEEHKKSSSKKTFILEEGGSSPEAFPGSLSLPLDILENEKQMTLSFDHVFIDSGTGMMACALLLGYAWLNKQALIHVYLMADQESFFLKQLARFHKIFEGLLGTACPFPSRFVLYVPSRLAGFGKTSQALFKDIVDLARTEGLLTDPIYTTKLFTEAKRLILEKELQGHILINHSGGTSTLSGFQAQLKKATDKRD